MTYPRMNIVFSSMAERNAFFKKVRQHNRQNKASLSKSSIIRSLISAWVEGKSSL